MKDQHWPNALADYYSTSHVKMINVSVVKTLLRCVLQICVRAPLRPPRSWRAGTSCCVCWIRWSMLWSGPFPKWACRPSSRLCASDISPCCSPTSATSGTARDSRKLWNRNRIQRRESKKHTYTRPILRDSDTPYRHYTFRHWREQLISQVLVEGQIFQVKKEPIKTSLFLLWCIVNNKTLCVQHFSYKKWSQSALH